jgi:Flp pilus assembly protein TadD
MKCWVGVAALALSVVACKAAPLRTGTAPSSLSVDELAAAIEADARRSEKETDPKIRNQLAADAARDGQACIARAPQSAACLYYHAIALGLDAKAHPLHVGEALKSMLASLDNAEAADPQYDQAGPARVKALVLVRAPGWPLGPGDAEAGLAAARKAAALAPVYPPNVLALAEAQAKTGDTAGARASYARARELSQALPPGADRDGWLREAEQGLAKK